MRFSTQMMYQQNMRGITNSQAEWMKYGEQMSTGKRVVNPSDDPIAASQAVVLSRAQAQNSQYTLARTFATQKCHWKRVYLAVSPLLSRMLRKNCLRQQWHLE